LWAGVGLFGAIISIGLAGAAMTYLNGEPPEREVREIYALATRPFMFTITRYFLLFINLLFHLNLIQNLFLIKCIQHKYVYILTVEHM
jgi:hypothetical protein